MSYITLEDLRAEGVSETEYPNDEYLESRIAIAQEFIDTVTGRFFEQRNYRLLLDGTGHDTLFLPVPPVNGDTAITEVLIDNDVEDSDNYTYPLRGFPDDRYNPRLIRLSGTWPRGTLNISITGDFGFVEPDGTTPPLIKHLCKMVTVWGLSPIADKSTSRESQIIEEELGDYRYRLSEVGKGSGMFGDQRIDNIIAMYRVRRMKAI